MAVLKPYFETKLGKLYCGDCLEVMPKLESGSIDMIFTDPPYGHNNNNGDLISRREAALGCGDYVPERDNRPIANDGDEANELFKNALKEFPRLLAAGCCCCCCCCGGGGPAPQFARWSLWIDEILNFKQMVVWDKGPMGMGWHYRRSYETILVAEKPGAACRWFDKSKKIENIIRPSSGIKKIIPSLSDHPTPKPVLLPSHFIMLHTQSGDVVIDPFTGGGSTILACEKLNRRWIGIEISEQYCELAAKRIEAETRQLKLFGG